MRSRNAPTFTSSTRTSSPSIILELDGSDLAELVLGALRPAAALVDGRLELAGDVALAMRLAPLLENAVVTI
jgi:putative sterol carrier protein